LLKVCQATHTTKQIYLRENGHLKIDSLVLLTRHDLCNRNTGDKICALFDHTQPCKESSCVVIQDSNLLTAYAIAQKLGHV
jgi:hypothetical protein